MFFNSRNNNKDSERGKSVGSKMFSFTGIRFFQPKFMDSLNNPSMLSHSNSQKPDQIIKKKDSKAKLPVFKQNMNDLKENINPFLQLRKNEITVKKSNRSLKICKTRGLHNIGNTCYMNSTLQCLLNLSRFNTFLLTELERIKKNSKNDVSIEYAKILEDFINSSSRSIFTPSKFKSAIGKKKCRFLGSGQQDAQQLLTAFLEILNEELSRIKQKPQYIELQNDPSKKPIKNLSQQWWEYYKKRDDSIICDFFQGQLISTVSCKKCGNRSVTFDNTWGMPLSLSKNTYSVSDLIRKYWNSENEITDYFCNKCQKHRVCLKKIQFFKLPQILVIQLKRFEYGKWKKEKIKSQIKLSETLDISSCVNTQSRNQNSLYRLTGMVHHYGEVDFGHYTASVYKQDEKRWYLMNDSKVSEETPSSPSNTVYLLFYQKVSENLPKL